MAENRTEERGGSARGPDAEGRQERHAPAGFSGVAHDGSAQANPKSGVSDQDISNAIRRRQIALVQGNVVPTLITNIGIGIILVAFQWTHVDPTLLSAWLVGMVLINLVRGYCAIRSHRTPFDSDDRRFWSGIYILLIPVTGAFWGVGSLIMMASDSVAHQAFFIVMVAGVCAGAIVTLSYVIEVCIGFLLIATAPLAIQLFMSGTRFHVFVGATVVLFMVLCVAVARRQYDSVQELIRLQIENHNLAEEATRSRNRLADFAETAGDWFWEQDEDLRFTYFSQRAEEITGVPVEFVIGKTRDDFVVDDGLAANWPAHREALINREPFRDFRYRRAGPDGRAQYLSISGNPLFDDKGRFRGYRGTGRDITASMEAELTWQRLHGAIEAVAEPIALFDSDDRLMICNRAYKRINAELDDILLPGVAFGALLETAIRRGLIRVPEGQWPNWIADRLKCRDDPSRSFEVQRADGRWFIVNDERLADGGVVSIETNVTDLKATEQALRRSEQRLRDYAETAADWFWEQDADLRFTYVSFDNARVSGIWPEEHYGKTRRETELLGMSQEKLRAHEDDLLHRRPFDDFRFGRTGPDGTERTLSISGKPIFDTNGEFAGYRGAGRDITALVEAERQALRDRDQAEEANRAKSRFLASMSHELRTPLNAILGFAQLLRLRMDCLAKQDIESVDQILANGEQLLTLINDVLDLSAMETGRIQTSLRGVSVRQVVTEAMAGVREMARRFGITVIDETAQEQSLWVRADAPRLKQILINLLSNAIKYNNPEGTVRIRESLAGDGYVRISVIDSGPGIEPDRQQDLFTPFMRLGREGLNVQGSGIGLAICRQLAGLMGGAIGYESSPGAGSVFWISLMAAGASEVTEVAPTPDPAPERPAAAEPMHQSG